MTVPPSMALDLNVFVFETLPTVTRALHLEKLLLNLITTRLTYERILPE